MPFIRIFLIFALLYLAARALGRFLFPSSGSRSFNRNNDDDRDVTIRNEGRRDKKYGKDEGEYVDFEEVD